VHESVTLKSDIIKSTLKTERRRVKMLKLFYLENGRAVYTDGRIFKVEYDYTWIVNPNEYEQEEIVRKLKDAKQVMREIDEDWNGDNNDLLNGGGENGKQERGF